jgi:hypothetical protein
MKHPLEFLPHILRKPFFCVFLALTIFIFGIFSFLDQPFRNSVSPNGIVSLELAFTSYRAHEIINYWEYAEWSGNELNNLSEGSFLRFGSLHYVSPLPFHYLYFGLGFDFLFMPVYALALSLGLLLAGTNKVYWYSSLTTWLGWGSFIAALFDAVENYALWKILTGSLESPYPQVAGICASIKFVLLILGLVTALAGSFIKKKLIS